MEPTTSKALPGELMTLLTCTRKVGSGGECDGSPGLIEVIETAWLGYTG